MTESRCEEIRKARHFKGNADERTDLAGVAIDGASQLSLQPTSCRAIAFSPLASDAQAQYSEAAPAHIPPPHSIFHLDIFSHIAHPCSPPPTVFHA